jgi:hypothetical protein
MGKSLHKACIYSISIAMTALTVAFVLSHVLPPASPAWGAEKVAEYYREHTTGLRIGAIFGAVGGMAYAPFCAAIAWEVKRMTRSSEAAYVQIIFGAITTLALASPWTIFGAASFRPERPAEITYALWDLAWLPLYLASGAFAVQFAFFAWAMLSDKRKRPTFPRWFAHYTVFTGIAQALGVLVLFDTSGPLAWNGVIAFWIPFVIFGAWTNLAVKYMTEALKAEPDDEPAAVPGDTAYLEPAGA